MGEYCCICDEKSQGFMLTCCVSRVFYCKRCKEELFRKDKILLSFNDIKLLRLDDNYYNQILNKLMKTKITCPECLKEITENDCQAW